MGIFTKIMRGSNIVRHSYNATRIGVDSPKGFTPTPISHAGTSAVITGGMHITSKQHSLLLGGIGVSSQRERGFTLVELIVSMALFIIVVFITTSAFFNITHLYKKATATRAAMDTLNIAVEQMVRNLRTSDFYHCGTATQDINITPSTTQDCASSGSTDIVYKDSFGRYGGYKLKDDAYGVDYDYIQSRVPARSSSCCEVLSGSDIYITALRFYSFGTITGVNKQPRLSIVVQGYALSDPDKTKFSIYTSVTQRAPK